MNIRELLNTISEELKDINPEVKNIHFTNIEFLFYILRSGLKGGRYYISANKKDKPELCTVRNHKIIPKKDELSSNVGDVKINLYTDRILAGVRGTKLRTIAELPQSDEEDYIKSKKNFKLLTGDNIESVNPFKFDKTNIKELKKRPSFAECDEFVEEKYKGFSASKKELITRALYYWNIYIRNFFFDRVQRETEERFILNRSIPVNKDFMKIEIVAFKSNEYTDLDKSKEEMQTDLNLLNRFKDVFVQNDNYELLKLTIKRLLNKKG